MKFIFTRMSEVFDRFEVQASSVQEALKKSEKPEYFEYLDTSYGNERFTCITEDDEGRSWIITDSGELIEEGRKIHEK